MGKRKKKKFTPGTVGAYFLRYDEEIEAWVTLIHRRARKLLYGGTLATPGGEVDLKDRLASCCFVKKLYIRKKKTLRAPMDKKEVSVRLSVTFVAVKFAYINVCLE